MLLDLGNLTDEQIKKTAEKSVDEVMETLTEQTPVYSVYFTLKGTNKKVHFANFFGNTHPAGENYPRQEDRIIKEMANLSRLIEEEQKKGNYLDIEEELSVEVRQVQFGGYMHKQQAFREDFSACSSAERAFILFKKEYKESKLIEEEKHKRFEEGIKASFKNFLDVDLDDEVEVPTKKIETIDKKFELSSTKKPIHDVAGYIPEKGQTQKEQTEKEILDNKLKQFEKDLDACIEIFGGVYDDVGEPKSAKKSKGLIAKKVKENAQTQETQEKKDEIVVTPLMRDFEDEAPKKRPSVDEDFLNNTDFWLNN